MAGNAEAHLSSFISRVERLEEERKGLSDDIKDVYAEAKSNGFNVKALKALIRRKAETAQQREARLQVESDLDLYLSKTGLLD